MWYIGGKKVQFIIEKNILLKKNYEKVLKAKGYSC
jgi:hypothetical protein